MALLRLVPGWAWIAMLATLAGTLGWVQMHRLAAERDAALAEVRTTRGEVAALESALEWRRENARRLLFAIEERDRALSTARDEIRGHRQALSRLESEDAETADWAAEPVPAAVRDWVRDLRATSGDAGRAGEPD